MSEEVMGIQTQVLRLHLHQILNTRIQVTAGELEIDRSVTSISGEEESTFHRQRWFYQVGLFD